MGKKAAPWRDQQGSSSSHTWGYWRGSWNTRSPSKPEPDGSKDISEFPKYHQMGQGGEAAVGQVTGGGAGDGQGELGDPLVKGLQKLLNQASKFDARARKCQTDLQLREEQWSKYQAQLRNSFLTQRHAYQQDRRKLEEDVAEVKIQKAKLVTQIQEMVQGRGRMAEPSSGQNVVASQDDLEAWSALMRDVQVEDEALQAASSPDVFLELMLSQLAQSEPGSVPFTTPQRDTTAPCSVTHSSRVVPFPPPVTRPQGQVEATLLGSIPATSDPYHAAGMSGVGGEAMGPSASLLQPSPAGRPKTPKPRLSIKEGARPTGPFRPPSTSPGRDSLLAAKRAQGMLGAVVSMEPVVGEQQLGAECVPLPKSFILDDDLGGTGADVDTLE